MRFVRVVLTSACFYACGGSTFEMTGIRSSQPSLTVCAENVAQIEIGDGFFRILCGCTKAGFEDPGAVFSSTDLSSSLTCHVSARSFTLIFYFSGKSLQHQILSPDSDFPPSTLVQPGRSPYMYSLHLSPSQSQIYRFQDPFNLLEGQIFIP